MSRKWKLAHVLVISLLTSTFLATACTESTAPGEAGGAALGSPTTESPSSTTPNLARDVSTAATFVLDVVYGGRWLSRVEYAKEQTILGKRVTGLGWDIAAGDGRCTRVYTRGKNVVLNRYTAWKLNGTWCAGAIRRYFQSERYLLYGDRVQVKLCAGTATTGALCKMGPE